MLSSPLLDGYSDPLHYFTLEAGRRWESDIAVVTGLSLRITNLTGRVGFQGGVGFVEGKRTYICSV